MIVRSSSDDTDRNHHEAAGIFYMDVTSRYRQLLLNDNGVVTGIVAETAEGKAITVSAKAVILATGGFAEGSASSFALSSGRLTARHIIETRMARKSQVA
jgi:succinate dehydrogenase/fumarate reductase flavoprotein subunit